ncbi:tail fiber domain-containing protein [Chitinophagaceae bacterium LB-8]|uniref:Tail fiber domain-containing protein n=1 Tax=Paraflavisolibacter caeni TaxID=2982496 RepID=A0A9X2XP52_9BACT|nr:tail fiber domain-containing protein [Paraflavisolibacter caeni]MCU7549944.1 tail fiber domain-containing protein [Paraflavisolibacter caeni]
MKKQLLLLLSTACIGITELCAQNWVNGGNTLTANGSIGTNSSHSLLFETSGVERGRITNGGNWAIGSTGTTSRFTVNSASGVSPFRAQVNGSTKLIVNSNGSTSIGSTTAGPTNGLYVAGTVGIGTAMTGASLNILNPGSSAGIRVTNNFTGNSDRFGIIASSVNNPGYGYGIQATGGDVGVFATAEAGSYSGSAYGVSAAAYGTTGGRYGIYGTASGGSFNAAGYFNGAVWATSYNYIVSDRKFKQDIVPLEHTLQQLMKLKPATYLFNKEAYKSMQLPTGKQIGLIADEVKEVFPELVQQAVHPAELDKDTRKELSPEIKYEGINYQGLIPVLVASVQELKTLNDEHQQQIEQQQQQINDLKETVDRLLNTLNLNGNNLTTAFLKASIPNPAQGTALIQYYVPQNSRTANIVFTDMKGAIIKSITISNKGDGQLNVNTAAWTAGTYTYTLYINGTQTDSKKLVIAR